MNKYTFMGNGRNKDFYFTFSFFSKGDIVVKINGTTATGYGVFCIPASTGNNDFPFTGGRIHFARAPKATDQVTIERKLQYNRLVDYQPTESLNPTTVNQDMNYFFESLKDIKSILDELNEKYAEFTDTESANDLKARINAVTEEIENLGDISTIQTSINSLNQSVSDLTSTIATHTTEIGTIKSQQAEMPDLQSIISVLTPGKTFENISIPASGTIYTPTKNGWIQATCTSSNGTWVRLINTTRNMAAFAGWNGTASGVNANLYVVAGDSVTVEFNGNYTFKLILPASYDNE